MEIKSGPVDLDQITVTDNPDESRYEARVGGELAGFAQYRRRPDAVVFIHTEVAEGYAGRGVGSALARNTLDDVRANGGRIVPLCPFIAAYVDRHPAYADLVLRRTEEPGTERRTEAP